MPVMVTTFLEANLVVLMPCCTVTWRSIKQRLLPPLKSDIRSDLDDGSNENLDLGTCSDLLSAVKLC